MARRVVWIACCLMGILFFSEALSSGLPEEMGKLDRESTGRLIRQAAALAREGKFEEAIPLAEAMLIMTERNNGSQHVDVATSLVFLAMLHRASGAPGKAEPLGLRALIIRERALGPGHPKTEEALLSLAETYKALGKFAQAEPLYMRVLDLRTKQYGPDHATTVAMLESLAEMFRAMGEPVKALPLCLRALAAKEKALGPGHPDLADSLHNMALIQQALGDNAEAERLHKRALAIREQAFGAERPATASSLNILGDFYKAVGKLDEAREMYARTLAIREKTLEPEHADTAASLNNLAEMYRSAGEYAKAEPVYRRAIAVLEKSMGPNHPDTALALTNCGKLALAMGEYAKAETYFLRSLTIMEAKLGPTHQATALCLSNLAVLYTSLGEFAKAELLQLRALSIWETALGADHPYSASALEGLAAIAVGKKDYPKGESLYLQALAVREKSVKQDPAQLAASLNNLAMLYGQMGEGSKAERLTLRALALRENDLGLYLPGNLELLNNLAVQYAETGANEKAAEYFQRAQRASSSLIEQLQDFTSEKQKLSFLSTQQSGLHAYLSLIRTRFPRRPEMVRSGLDCWLQRKGLVLETQKRSQNALVSSNNPEIVQSMQSLSALRAELSALAFAGPGKDGADAYRKRLRVLEQRKEVLQTVLSGRSQAFALSMRKNRVDAGQLAAIMPKGTVLVDVALVQDYDFAATGKVERWSPARYLAFVLPAGRPQDVQLVDLGESKPIDAAIAAYKASILTNVPGPVMQRAQELYSRVFSPLVKCLGTARQVYLSLDGALSLVPFETFQTPDGRFLLEQYTFTHLAAGRDLLGFGTPSDQSRGVLVIGDPDFDLDAAGYSQALSGLSMANRSGGRLRSAGMAGMTFERLPSTRQEALAIQTLLGAQASETFLDKNALEEVLTTAHSPKVVHLATHAFFLPAQERQGKVDDENSSGALFRESPLLRSGLVLAGANRALRGEQGANGVLTAEKVMSLDLKGTELVVLSACSTGAGEVREGEGVYGLQRAFVQAGAQSMVMSMWPVPDEETKELMVAFYGNLKAGMNRAQALRQAALKELKIAETRHGSRNPLFWGAFVFLGDPGLGVGQDFPQLKTAAKNGVAVGVRNKSTTAKRRARP